jgi:glycerol-1-phosphate dehydrogenase [NAD(P)+]
VKRRAIDIPRVVEVSRGCRQRLPGLLASHFDAERICLGSGKGPSAPIAERIAVDLRESGRSVRHVTGLCGRLDQAAELAGCAIRDDVTLMVGVGGGRVVDTVKLAAARTGIDFVSVPTAISHDGISSPVASLLGGEGRRESHAATMPAGILIDLELIAAAPIRTLRAGLGDLLSNLVAILDWELAAERGLDTFDPFAAMIAEQAARSALDITDLDGADAHETLAKGLLLSGLAMAAAGTSRPCSGAEHLISHSLDQLLGERAAMHGEQVALGCLFAAAAHDSPLLETFMRVFERTGVPITPAAVGISADEFAEAVRLAPSTRPERFTVLTDLIAGGGNRLAKLAEMTFEPSPA